jgi:hypothetical protein
MTGWLAIVAGIVLAGCTQDVDAAWQLDHERVIAVRSTPSRIAPGETAVLDALLGHKGAPPSGVDPDTAEVVSPSGLDAALSRTGAHWTVAAPPDDDQLAPARAELGLGAGDPVPLRVRMVFATTGEVAYKVVWLGEHADNPVISPISIAGMDGLAITALPVAATTNIPLAVDLDSHYDINWLTSCGTMHDFDLARAYLRVEPEDPHAGQLGLVVRDDLGGVEWHLWTITAQ